MREKIPAIIKDVDQKYGEICEIDENLKRSEFSLGNEFRHIHRKETLLKELGLTYQQGYERFAKSEIKTTIKDLATRKHYLMNDNTFLGTIVDIGMHDGKDTLYYASRGYKVIAYEANPELCTFVKQKLNNELI